MLGFHHFVNAMCIMTTIVGGKVWELKGLRSLKLDILAAGGASRRGI